MTVAAPIFNVINKLKFSVQQAIGLKKRIWAFLFIGGLFLSEFKRDFKGIWIPKEIWLDEELKIMEKIFLVEIDSLDNEQGCFASNSYFAEFFDLTNQRCSQIINRLLFKKYISIEYERKGKEIVKRTIKVLNKFNRVLNKSEQGIKKSLTRYKENAKGNNTTNNTVNNIKKEKKIIPPTKDEIKEYLKQKDINNFDIDHFFDYFNDSNWTDSKCNKVKNWKQKVLTYHRNGWCTLKNEHKLNIMTADHHG